MLCGFGHIYHIWPVKVVALLGFQKEHNADFGRRYGRYALDSRPCFVLKSSGTVFATPSHPRRDLGHLFGAGRELS